MVRRLASDEDMRKAFFADTPAKMVMEQFDFAHVQSVYMAWGRLGLYKGKPQSELRPFVPPTPVIAEGPPPSLAMIRLAEFDPVVMRALRMRRGEAVELPPDSRFSSTHIVAARERIKRRAEA